MRLIIGLLIFSATAISQGTIPETYKECYHLDGFSFHHPPGYTCEIDSEGRTLTFQNNKGQVIYAEVIKEVSEEAFMLPDLLEHTRHLCLELDTLPTDYCADPMTVRPILEERGMQGYSIFTFLKHFQMMAVDVRTSPGEAVAVVFWTEISDNSPNLNGFFKRLYLVIHDAAG